MNSTVTDHAPYEIDRREAYRQSRNYLCLRCRMGRCEDCLGNRCTCSHASLTRGEPWLDEPISLSKALGLVLFVMAVVAGIARWL